MKRLTTTLMVLAGSMFMTGVLLADDVDEVKTATLRHFSALNAGDTDAYMDIYMEGFSVFNVGGFLNRFGSVQEQRKAFQGSVDAGFKRNFQLRHLEVKVYGDSAVTTSYLVGTETSPEGTSRQVARRRTTVLVKRGGEWKEVHRHSSPVGMVPAP